MTIYVLGSINVDHVYRVPHFPDAGETLATTGYAVGLGGKGANQAIAAASAGAKTCFIGAVGEDGLWARKALADRGVDVEAVAIVAEATGHAIIFVEPSGENRIVIHGGANQAILKDEIGIALGRAATGDWWLTQNETNLVAEGLAAAKAKGLRTAYAAAPFDPRAIAEALPHTDALFVNEGEDAALTAHLGDAAQVALKITTLGARGALINAAGQPSLEIPSFNVEPVDTTGAGDTFTGAFLACLDTGAELAEAGRFASAAAALCVTRQGAADAIPSRAEIDAFLKENS